MRCGVRGVLGRRRLRHEELEEGEIGLRPELAGEPDRRIGRADAVEHEGLARRRRRQLAAVSDHANAAGGAAGAAAADACMRDMMAQARLEHAQALRHPDRPAVAIGQADHAAAALGDRTHASRRQSQADQAEIADQEIVDDVVEHVLLGRGADLVWRKVVGPPLQIVGVVHDAASALIDAEHGQRRNQHRGGEQERRGAPVERLHPQPEVKPDRAVDPGDQEDREHQPDQMGPRHPEHVKLLRIDAFRVRTAPRRAGRRRRARRRAPECSGRARAAAARSPSSEIPGAGRAPRCRGRHAPVPRCKTRSRPGGIARTRCGRRRPAASASIEILPSAWLRKWLTR